MRSPAATQRRCSCSAAFKRKTDLKRHLSEHAEQRRIRDRMIGDLQAEALKHEAHAEADGKSSSESEIDESDIDQDSEGEGDGESEGTSGQCRRRRLSEALVCPSCPRSKPFTTKHKLRRHYEQDTECNEVCVFCHESFKRVRKFKRHAENCSGENERKRAYMDETCKELTRLSNTKLDKALQESKKRPRGDSEHAANPVESTRRNPRAPKRQRNKQQHADIAADTPDLLSSYTASTGVDLYLVRSSGAPEAPTNFYSLNQTQSLSVEANEAVVPSLDIPRSFDSPLVEVMNAVPLNYYSWPVNAYDETFHGNNPAVHNLS